MTKRQEKKEKTSRKLLKIAKQLFMEKGFYEFSLRDLAKRANMAPSNIYNYFQSKRELWFALVREEFDVFDKNIQKIISENDFTLESFKKYGEYYLNFALTNPKEYELMFTIQPPPAEKIGPIEEQHKAVVFERLVKYIQHGIKKGLLKQENPVFLAYYIWGTLHGAVLVSQPLFKEEKQEMPIIDRKKFFEFVLNQLQKAIQITN